MCSVGEALFDPVLQLSVRFDFDMNLYACVSVCACLPACMCVCVCVHQRFTMARLHYHRPVLLLPGCLAYSSIPTGLSLFLTLPTNSLAPYHDNIIFTIPEFLVSPCSNSYTYPQTANSPPYTISPVTDFI